MNNERLKEANEIKDLIDKTQQALTSINKFLNNKDNKEFYCMFISEYEDGSGNPIILNREKGNYELLCLIKEEIKTQLIKYQKEFGNL